MTLQKDGGVDNLHSLALLVVTTDQKVLMCTPYMRSMIPQLSHQFSSADNNKVGAITRKNNRHRKTPKYDNRESQSFALSGCCPFWWCVKFGRRFGDNQPTRRLRP